MQRIRRNAKGLAITLTLLACAACSGGGGGGSSAPKSSSLSGSWVGTEKMQPSGDWVELRVTVNGDDKITGIRVDGVDTGATGTISPTAKPNIFDVVLSDGTEGGFFVDAQARHAVFVDEEANFAVLQKGATGKAVPNKSKIFNEHFVGTSAVIGGDFEITALDRQAWADVYGDGGFDLGHFGLTAEHTDDTFYDGNGNPVGGALDLYDGTPDALVGLWKASDGSIGLCYVVPTQDHQMVGVWGIEWDHDHFGTDWSDWTFSAMTRQ